MSNRYNERQSSQDPVVECKEIRPSDIAEQSSCVRRGKAIAIRLAEDGFDVCINDIQTNSQAIDEVNLSKATL